MRHQQAILKEGWRVASGQSNKDPMFNEDGGTIRLQIAAFKKHGLDLDEYFDGKPDQAYVCATLGLDVAPYQVEIVKPEYHLTGVRWTDKFDKPGEPPFLENFFLSPAQVQFEGKTYKGLIYIPDPSTKPGHFQPSSRIEVVAEPVEGIRYGMTVGLIYNEAAIDLKRAL